MPTFTRRNGEGVVFVLPDGELIHVRAQKSKKGSTKLNCLAPKDVKIWRDEVLQKSARLEKENVEDTDVGPEAHSDNLATQGA